MPPSPTELARQAMKHSEELQSDFLLLKQQVDTNELPNLRDRLILLEARLSSLEKFDADVRRIGILEDRISELKRAKEETDKRQWQFVYIFAGAMASLLVTVVVQLLMMLFKKT